MTISPSAIKTQGPIPTAGLDFDISSLDMSIVVRLFELFNAKKMATENANSHHETSRFLVGCRDHKAHGNGLTHRINQIDASIKEFDPKLVKLTKEFWDYMQSNPDAQLTPKALSPVVPRHG